MSTNADQPNNQAPPPVAGIHQTVNSSSYVRLEYAPRSLGFPKKDFDWYRNAFDNFLRKTYKGIERDEIGYSLILDRFANVCFESGGKMAKSTYNLRVDFYNNYVTLASHIDSLNIESEFKITLKDYYATKIIQKGSTVKDTDAEKEKLNSIPSDSIIVTAKPRDD